MDRSREREKEIAERERERGKRGIAGREKTIFLSKNKL